MVEGTDIAIVGAGVVGLAIAAELSKDQGVVVLDRHEGYGRENSSHNSGVVHAGVYYPADWLKTRLCIEGNRLLYEWAERHNVRAQRLGKLIIATEPDELSALEALFEAATANGVPELELLSARAAQTLEPDVRAVGAIHSGTSGVIDQMELMRSLFQAAYSNGALFAFKHTVTAIERDAQGFVLTAADPDGEQFRLTVRALVNSAGLGADALASMLGYPLDERGEVPRLRQWVNRGRYYDIVNGEKASRLRHLVYPLPHGDRAGLGVHVTMDIDGSVHLGPDAQWLDEGESIDFRSADTRRDEFVEAARRYLPWLEPDDIAPGQVGYRTKRHGPGEPPQDFLIWQDRGYVHLGGIESPGMTACLSIARRVAAELAKTDLGSNDE